MAAGKRMKWEEWVKGVAVGEGKGGDYKYTRLLNRKKWVPK